ncbi:MAG: hypothetical protein ACREVE_05570 [Gammaproteobacteria bacterium]
MKSRLIFHFVGFVVLVGAGVWIAYQAIAAPLQIGFLVMDVEFAAMYWFTLLIYGFVWLVLYFPLRRRAWPFLLIGHTSAAAIALVSTLTVVTLGERNSPAPNEVPSESTHEAYPPRLDAEPGALPLPVPSREDSPGD